MKFITVSDPYNNNDPLAVVRNIGHYDSYDKFSKFIRKVIHEKDSYAFERNFGGGVNAYEKLIFEEKNTDFAKVVSDFQQYRENNLIKINQEHSPKFDFTGEMVDIGRFTSGDPECMYNFFGDADSSPRFLDVKMRMSCPAWTFENDGMEKVFAYYTPILDIIDNWENAGIRCKISLDFQLTKESVLREKGDQVIGSVVMKNYGDIFDTDLFCRLFMTKVGQLTTFMIHCLATRFPGSYPDCERWSYRETTNYNPEKPDQVIFPSSWYAWVRDFKKTDAKELLLELGRPNIEI